MKKILMMALALVAVLAMVLATPGVAHAGKKIGCKNCFRTGPIKGGGCIGVCIDH